MTTVEPCPLSGRHQVRFGGHRGGPTVTRPAYELAVNGDEHLARATFAVATWAAQVHFAATTMTPPVTP